MSTAIFQPTTKPDRGTRDSIAVRVSAHGNLITLPEMRMQPMLGAPRLPSPRGRRPAFTCRFKDMTGPLGHVRVERRVGATTPPTAVVGCRPTRKHVRHSVLRRRPAKTRPRRNGEPVIRKVEQRYRRLDAGRE